jgi:hypothetical protein
MLGIILAGEIGFWAVIVVGLCAGRGLHRFLAASEPSAGEIAHKSRPLAVAHAYFVWFGCLMNTFTIFTVLPST